MAKYFAVTFNNNNLAVRTPLLAWIRQNSDQLPENFPGTGTTREIKRALLRLGWTERTGTETVYVIRPDDNNSIEYANNDVNDLEMEAEENEDEIEVAQELTFGLERDLQQALRRNIQFLEPGLEIIDGGRERHTQAGFIDITARDSQGRIVVIELKAPIAKPEVIAQTLAYMQAVHTEEQSEVRGIIIASDFVDRVKLAARQTPNIKLVSYAFQFNFHQVE